MTEEIILHSAMLRNELTLKEAVAAMEIYANDKKFQKQLDEVYQVEVFDDWDWHEGALDLK